MPRSARRVVPPIWSRHGFISLFYYGPSVSVVSLVALTSPIADDSPPSSSSASTTASIIAESYRRSAHSSHSQAPPLPTVVAYPRSSVTFEPQIATPAAARAKSAAQRQSHKRKLHDTMFSQSYAQTSWMPLRAEQDALLQPSSFMSPSSVFKSVVLHDEPTPEYTGEFDAPLFESHGSLGARSSDGELFTWPWLQQHSGQVWSAPSQREENPSAQVFKRALERFQRSQTPQAASSIVALDQLIHLGLDHASADGSRGRTHSGVRAWFAFTQDQMGTSPHRPMDPLCPLQAKLQEEWLFMEFACALIRDRGVTIGTVRGYCSAVQGWHAREHGIKLAAGLKLERLPQMLKGLRRVYGDPEVKLRRGFAPQALRKAMDMLLDPAKPVHANIRAAIALGFQGLLRSAEFTVKSSRHFNPQMHLTRADLKVLDAEKLVVMMAPCKNMKHLGGKTSPLVIGGGGTFIDAVAELRNLLAVDPTPLGKENVTPLFRDPHSNSPLCYDELLKILRTLMLQIGEDPDQFGTHSLRIGGATALFAAGADETVIRTMGRWSSDIHRLYVRACFERCCDWTKKAGSVTVTDVSCVFDDGEDDDAE